MRSDPDYEAMMDRMLDDIFTEMDNHLLGKMDLAFLSGLSYNTIWRLNNRTTRLPRLQTVYKMARCLGIRLELYATDSKKRRNGR